MWCQRLILRLTQVQAIDLLSFISCAFVGIGTLSNPPESGRKALALIGVDDMLKPFSEILQKQTEIFLNGLLAPSRIAN